MADRPIWRPQSKVNLGTIVFADFPNRVRFSGSRTERRLRGGWVMKARSTSRKVMTLGRIS
jgi:hypothetical protein